MHHNYIYGLKFTCHIKFRTAVRNMFELNFNFMNQDCIAAMNAQGRNLPVCKLFNVLYSLSYVSQKLDKNSFLFNSFHCKEIQASSNIKGFSNKDESCLNRYKTLFNPLSAKQKLQQTTF